MEFIYLDFSIIGSPTYHLNAFFPKYGVSKINKCTDKRERLLLRFYLQTNSCGGVLPSLVMLIVVFILCNVTQKRHYRG